MAAANGLQILIVRNFQIPKFRNFGSFVRSEIPEFWQPEFRNFGNEIIGCGHMSVTNLQKNYHFCDFCWTQKRDEAAISVGPMLARFYMTCMPT